MGNLREGVLIETPRHAPASLPTGSLMLAVFLSSAAILHLEILQTRIFSVLLWHHLTYLVVTFTMLGFAAGGTFLSLFPGLVRRNPVRFLSTCSLLFSCTTIGAYWLLGRSELDTLKLLENRVQYLYVFAYYLYLVIPYFFAGMVVVASLQCAGARTNLIYGANLAGSAAGCLTFAFTLAPLGGEGSLALAAALAAAGAAAFACARVEGRRQGPLLVGSAAVALLAAASIPWADRLLPIRAASSKLLVELMDQARSAGKEPRVELTRWDPLCRIDVVDLGDPTRRVFQDADAPTEILPADQPFDFHSIYCLPYRVAKKHPDVLVIGVGGGQDLRQALWNEATSVTGVEINRTTASLLRREYAQFSGNVYTMPNVEVIETEGRSFARRSDRSYDLIQMTGTDTYAALASGSYVLSESYLYTLDAMRDFFDHLKPGGIVSVLRFRFFPPREGLRLVVTAVEALKQRGVAHPERNVIVIDKVHEVPSRTKPGTMERIAYAAMLFKESAFTPEEILDAEQFVTFHPLKDIVYRVAYLPGREVQNEFGEYLKAVSEGTDAAYRASYPYNIDPVDDGSPFFFQYHRWSSVLKPTKAADYLSAIGRDPVGLFLLLTALLESALLVALLVILPLCFSRRISLPKERRGPLFLYFLGIGVGFLFLEIATMQRLVLYLGHPTRSITIVLFSFLLFSGLGSLAAGRWQRETSARVALRAIVLLVALYAVGLPWILHHTLSLSTEARMAISVALLSIPSFFMGMPFPAAMARLKGSAQPFLPWAFAINGGASVVASVGSVFLAMTLGFTAVFWLAALFYAVALVVEPRLPRSTA